MFWAYTVHCDSPQGACLVFPGLDTLVRPVERCSLLAVHTICPLQLSCPLPTGPETGRTDLDPCVTLLHWCSFFMCVLGDLCLDIRYFLRMFCLLNVPKKVSPDWSFDQMILLAMLTRAHAYGFYFSVSSCAVTWCSLLIYNLATLKFQDLLFHPACAHAQTHTNTMTCSSVTC